MSKVYFRKNVNDLIYISDNKEKYELSHPYFSFSNKEIPYDSHIFKDLLDVGTIVVVKIDEDFTGRWDFKKYMVVDEQLIEQEKEAIQIKKKEQKQSIKNQEKFKKKLEKEQKIKEEQIKKKEAEESVIDIIDDEEILKHL